MIQSKEADFLSQIKAASKMLAEQKPEPRPDFVILHPKMVSFYKKQEGFEPLYDYIDKVCPYNGEVGRYDTGGTKIRIIQAKEWRG